MACKVKYKDSVYKDLKQIDKTWAKKILDKIDSDLADNPGKDKELTGDHSGLYSYRVGDYRVIYSIIGEETETTLLVLRISHRKNAYD